MKRIIVFLYLLFRDFFNSNCCTRAGSLAFTTIIAIVPLMIVGMGVLSILPISDALQGRIQDFVVSNFLADSAQIILSYLHVFVARAHTLSLISIIFLLFTAVSMLLSIESSLNAIWGIDEIRAWHRALFFYLVVLLLVPLLMTMSLLLSFSIEQVMSYIPYPHNLSQIIISITPIVLSYFGYLMIYKMMPNCVVPWRSAHLSAVLAALLFEGAKIIFAWYLEIFPTYQIVYGAVSAIPILFIWIYICWLIFLFAALVGCSSTLSQRAGL